MFYILLVKYANYWTIDCGDYDREKVKAAYLEYKRTGTPKKWLKIISNDTDNPEHLRQIVTFYNDKL